MVPLHEFEWDLVKARGNFDKHGLTFERAATVFLDPLALTVRDEEHSGDEARWITLGRDATGAYVLLVHTFFALGDEQARIRVISARKPTKSEVWNYEEHQ
jgi:uncharacterized protein